MAVMPGNFADFVMATLAQMGPPRFSQIAQTVQRYEVFGKWWKKDKVKFQGGKEIQGNLMVNTLGEAEHLDMMAEDTFQLGDYGAQFTIPWVRAQTKWSIHRIIDVSMNTGKPVIWNTIDMKQAASMIDLADILEATGWAAPADADDVTKPYGLPYYIVKAASAGFTGMTAFGSTVAGVNPTTYPTYRNYGGTYTDVTWDDLIVSLIKGHHLCNFISPVTMAQYRSDLGQNYRYYVNLNTSIAMAAAARNQNDNLGNSLAAMDGQAVFKNHPIVEIPYLANDTQNPVYWVDHSTFHPVVLSGWFMNQEVITNPANHLVVGTFVNTVYNYRCMNRRKNGVVYIA